VNDTLLSDALLSIGVTESSVRARFQLSRHNLEGLVDTFFFVYYMKRDLKRILIYECRCNERLKAKAEGSTLLSYTICLEWVGFPDH